MQYLVLSSSLAPASRSRLLARAVHTRLVGRDASAAWVDAGELDLPHCDGGPAWEHPDARTVKQAIEAADGIVLSLGIYNYAASAVAKTLVELGGPAWSDKVVAATCSAGGGTSYMATLGLLNSLMLDFRCVVVPRFVFATSAAFEDDRLIDPDIDKRLDGLVDDLVRMTEALRKKPEPVTAGRSRPPRLPTV